MSNGSSPHRDLSFFKWFVSLGSFAIIGFVAFVFNVVIDNQARIREILIEIRNIKSQEAGLAADISEIIDRINDYSIDPVHGWGQRWSRAEAQRENDRQDKTMERLTNGLEHVRVRVSDLHIPLAKAEAEIAGLNSRLLQHDSLAAHREAGHKLVLLREQVENLRKAMGGSVDGME